jgi:hypothetical protein
LLKILIAEIAEIKKSLVLSQAKERNKLLW